MIAALFTDPNGPYHNRSDVDAWPESRDARKYQGPHVVLAHPPCERFGRYWSGGPNPNARRFRLGDDGGCFAFALSAVRRFGGVLEHPEASHAWRLFGIATPPKSGGWIRASSGVFMTAWTCCVEQGHYGHPARKATWLYYLGSADEKPPELIWGPSQGGRIDEGFHSKESARAARAREDFTPVKRLSKDQRIHTPPAFAELLIGLAKSAAAKPWAEQQVSA